jgi:hypothetical protein
VILARRIDDTNQAFVELKSEIQEKSPSVIDITIKKIQRLLGGSGATFAHGHSYNPFA